SCRSGQVLVRLHDKEDTPMQYLLLIYENEKRFAKGYDPAELKEYRGLGQEYASIIKGGAALKPTNSATTVRLREGKRLTTDGPFAETKEQLGGFYLVEARDIDEAIAMAGKIPAARYGCIELRPIMTFE
ncbi:MAG TPA: YciI family protein, partial [Myxococcales bacterium]|nr:YciI family protein [Myxococcales bacterium]